MKRIISFILALTMVCSLFAIPVMAETGDEALQEQTKLNKSEYISIPLDSGVTMGVDSADSSTYTWDHFPIHYRTSASFGSSCISLDANSC